MSTLRSVSHGKASPRLKRLPATFSPVILLCGRGLQRHFGRCRAPDQASRPAARQSNKPSQCAGRQSHRRPIQTGPRCIGAEVERRTSCASHLTYSHARRNPTRKPKNDGQRFRGRAEVDDNSRVTHGCNGVTDPEHRAPRPPTVESKAGKLQFSNHSVKALWTALSNFS